MTFSRLASQRGERIWERIGILLVASVNAGEILLDKDRQFTAGAKVYVTLNTDSLTLCPGASNVGGNDDFDLPGGSLHIETGPVAISCKGVG